MQRLFERLFVGLEPRLALGRDQVARARAKAALGVVDEGRNRSLVAQGARCIEEPPVWESHKHLDMRLG